MPAPRGDKWETDIERRLAQLEQRASRPLSNTGLSSPAPNVTQVNGELVVNGGVSQSGNYESGVSGWATKGDGTAEFKDIILYDLPNSMLANPVVPQSIWKGTTSNFALTVAWAATVSQTVTVPDGCTKLLALATTRLVAQNTTASTDAVYSDMDIGGQSAGGFALEVLAGKAGQSSTTFSRLMPGLTPGDTVTLTAYASSGSANWPAPADPNVQQFAAMLIWLR